MDIKIPDSSIVTNLLTNKSAFKNNKSIKSHYHSFLQTIGINLSLDDLLFEKLYHSTSKIQENNIENIYNEVFELLLSYKIYSEHISLLVKYMAKLLSF